MSLLLLPYSYVTNMYCNHVSKLDKDKQLYENIKLFFISLLQNRAVSSKSCSRFFKISSHNSLVYCYKLLCMQKLFALLERLQRLILWLLLNYTLSELLGFWYEPKALFREQTVTIASVNKEAGWSSQIAGDGCLQFMETITDWITVAI